MMDLKNKDVSIYYDDSSNYNKVARKDGHCLDDTDHKITIRNQSNFIEVIPYSRIIRVIEKVGGK